MQKISKKDCVEAANPSLARRTRFQLLAQRGIERKYGHTVDSLCGNPLCICDEHVIYRPWKALTKPTKWGEYAEKLAALKVGKSFEIADYSHSQPEISNLRASHWRSGSNPANVSRDFVKADAGSHPGHRVTVLVALASTGGTPINNLIGKEMKLSPPARAARRLDAG